MIKTVARWLRGRIVFVLAWLVGYVVALASGVDQTVALAATVPVLVPGLWPRKSAEPIALPAPAREPAHPDRLREVKSAFAGFDSPVYLLDESVTVLFQNQSAVDAFGDISAGQHISARIRNPAVLDMIREALASGRPGQTELAPSLTDETTYLVRMIPADAETGSGDFWVLIFRDISEARRIDRMRSDFVANASHELRTPLASLRGFIETLQGPAKNDQAAQAKFLAIMLEQVTRMSRLVDDLLSLSRLELKARVAPEEELDLVPLIGAVCDTLAPLAAELGVTIRRMAPDEPLIVRGDRDELTQVFENLIENGCKYAQDGKFVDVVLSAPQPGTAEVNIIDYGPGIPSAHVPRLTERFYRVNVESSRSKKGTGLGLAIVKHILTRHRARLLIRSEIGKGSTFTVRF